MSGKACVCLSEASAQNFFLLFPNGECVCWGGFIFDPKNNLQSIFGGYFSDFGKKLPHNLPNRASGGRSTNPCMETVEKTIQLCAWKLPLDALSQTKMDRGEGERRVLYSAECFVGKLNEFIVQNMF